MKDPFPILENSECWPAELEPNPNGGTRSRNMEPFEEYIARTRTQLGHLPAQVIEQWVYRHYQYTKFRNIPLESLTVSSQTWSNKQILEIGSERHTPEDLMDEVEDEEYFAKWKSEPAITIRKKGTWNIPILVLHNSGGFLSHGLAVTPYKYWLIEGHQRFRFLNHWIAMGKAKSQHRIWLLELEA